MASSFPYQNRGSYQWVPDDYAATTGSDFDVTQAYDFLVVDRGFPINVMPPSDLGFNPSGNPVAEFAHTLSYLVRAVDGAGNATVLTELISDAVGYPPLVAPFASRLMRWKSTALQHVTNPSSGMGVGFCRTDIPASVTVTTPPPFFFIETDQIDYQRLASITIDYALLTEQPPAGSPDPWGTGPPPLTVLAVFDPTDPNNTEWLGASGSDGTDSWGPISAQIATESQVAAAIKAVATSFGGGSLEAAYLPPYRHDGSGKVVSLPELSVSAPGAYGNGAAPIWTVTTFREADIRTRGDAQSLPGNYPILRGILIMPDFRPITSGGPPSCTAGGWNAVITGLRLYSALPCNGTPKTTQNGLAVPAQFPCQILGYAFRVNNVVAPISANMALVQPTIGTSLSDSNTGQAPRTPTFQVRIYQPDTPGLGLAHGVSFFYTIVALAIPASSPLAWSDSLVGELSSMGADEDLVEIQYVGPLPTRFSVNLVPGTQQLGGGQGMVAYGGGLGYGASTQALRCLKTDAVGDQVPTPSSTWTDLGNSTFPDGSSVNPDGLHAMWQDPKGTVSSWYSFLSVGPGGTISASAGEFTPATHGTPLTSSPGPGAFSMTNSLSAVGGTGTARVEVRTKVAVVPTLDVATYCGGGNDTAHLATFVSELLDFSPSSIMLSPGAWGLNFAASVDDDSRMATQIFYRFAFISWDVDPATVNASALWTTLKPNQLLEFYFRQELNQKTGLQQINLCLGTPTAADVIAGDLLSTQETAPDLSWTVTGVGTPTGTTSSSTMNGTVVTYGPGITVSITDKNDFDANITISSNALGVPPPTAPTPGGLRIVMQAWAVSFALPGIPPPGTPTSDPNFPAVTFAWDGTQIGSMLQTTLFEVESNAILPEQFTYWNTSTFTSLNVLRPINSPPGPAPISTPRSVALWADQLVAGKNAFISGSPDNLTRLSDPIAMLGNGLVGSNSSLSITGLSPAQHLDMSPGTAQVADTIVVAEGSAPGQVGATLSIGGGSIPAQSAAVSFSWKQNVSTFDVVLRISFCAVDPAGIALYHIGVGSPVAWSTGGNSPGASASGTATTTIDIPDGVLLPANCQPLLRFEVWAFDNANTGRPIVASQNVDLAFFCIDLSNVLITFPSGVPTLTMTTASRGTNDFYLGLPLASARTFGDWGYTFVPDADSTATVILPPSTIEEDSQWTLSGWMFSPFWYLGMLPDAVIEFEDIMNLTGVGYDPRLMQEMVLLRTAVGTLPANSLSMSRETALHGGSSALARSAFEVPGAAVNTNAISAMGVSREGIDAQIQAFPAVIGGTAIAGRNPLIVGVAPGSRHLRRFRPGDARNRFLFYELNSPPSGVQSSLAVLTDPSGQLSAWQDPGGVAGSGLTDPVIISEDMTMVGCGVDPHDSTIFLVGWRALDPALPLDGGLIVMRDVAPGLLLGQDSASSGPLHFVDGLLFSSTTDAWSHIAGTMGQPLLPLNDGTAAARANSMGTGGTALPANQSFPSALVDQSANLWVFYTLMDRDAGEALTARGKVFCRGSYNGGYWFGEPFPVADLGYSSAVGTYAGTGDPTFEAKHICCLYDDENLTCLIFFWAGGKVFMKVMEHPQGLASEISFLREDGAAAGMATAKDPSSAMLWMVAGSTDFVAETPPPGLENWLKYQYGLGTAAAIVAPGIDPGWVGLPPSTWDNWGQPTGAVWPSIRIVRFADEQDVPEQRVAATMTPEGNQISLYYQDSIGRLMWKQILLQGQFPQVGPALIVSPNVV